MAYDLIGKNFTPPDLEAKVTGRAKYSEDFRPDGMLFAKLLTSPVPHGRIRNLDVSAALALPGVEGVLSADEVPNPHDLDVVLRLKNFLWGWIIADTRIHCRIAVSRVQQPVVK